MKIALVGGRGFIGRRFARQAMAAGHAVHEVAGNVTTDPITVPAGTDVVLYLAQSRAHRQFPRHAGDLYGVNVSGALRAADAARAGGARLFVYASSGTVYRPGFEPFTETHPVRRDGGYPLSKVAAEEALALIPEPRTLCVRLFGVFGPGQTAALVPGVTDRVRGGRPVTIERHPLDPADRDGLRVSLTFVDDLVDRLLAIAAAGLAGRGLPPVLNVAGGEPISIRGLATTIGERLGVEPRFDLVERSRESDYVADLGRLRDLVDSADTPIDDAIAKTALHAAELTLKTK